MKAEKLLENIYFVGAIDRKLRSFHGYETGRGSTYNAYLVIDDKITLIDTVKEPFRNEMLERIESVVPVEKIDYLISNHVEPDHSGAIPFLLGKNPNLKIFTSFPQGANGLKAYYGENLPLCPVKTGDKLSTGKYTFRFVGTPMVHWPDNMVTYLEEERILFSNDAFGEHYATETRFASEVDNGELWQEFKKYYANIVQPYGRQALAAIESVAALPVDAVYPSHGVILDGAYIAEAVKRYASWAKGENVGKAVIVYDSMWGSTEKMAVAIGEGFRDAGLEAKLFDLKVTHESDVITETMDAAYVAVGSPTLNNGLLASVAKFLCYLKGLTVKGKKFIAFGSYGWGGQSVGEVKEALLKTGYSELCPEFRLKYRPSQEELESISKTVMQAVLNS